MFDTVCTLPLSSDFFTQAVHPSEPLVAVGLYGGHVETFRLPAPASDDSDEEASHSPNGFGKIDTLWRTRRHKGSCRSVGFGIDGEALYSAGTDGLVKAASTETGQVTSKIAIPSGSGPDADAPSLLHALSPQTLLLATDSSALHLYDLRENNFTKLKPQQTHHPHDDYVSSLTPLPASDASTSGFSKQWVTTGGTTIAVTDLRRGVLVRSEDQEEELLSSVFVGGLPAKPGRSKGEKVLVGGAAGVLTLWERGVWDDQDERIIVERAGNQGESLDTLTLVPDEIGPFGKIVAVGMGDGRVKFVKLGPNKVIGEVRHDEVEGVMGLDFDVGGRMISGGGSILKVWHEKVEGPGELEEGPTGKGFGSDDDSDADDASDSSDDEGSSQKRRKRRKRTKGKQQVQHVMAFKGMD
ncbi:WD40 repeat-like protein [Xylona heveae TC161]|uniref:WD repeat-containing protein JIP5 n=1 Tax=Xylona heveae (strain CBS 132557 / TC161) TaxID=1328760 RepID=A0A165JD06_XYLHT|nr:WD40 repeat-like protein [Xylona heveae TC161]KZF26072.1 WD40 repeat-like protein [Xylona heveae TC161]